MDASGNLDTTSQQEEWLQHIGDFVVGFGFEKPSLL